MSLIIWLAPLLAVSQLSWAKAEPKSKTRPNLEVNTVLSEYRRAPAIQAKVKKTVTQETMGTESKSQGQFYFAKGKLRLDILQPERTSLVYDGKTIWFESRLDDQHVTVTKMRATDLRKSDSILTALFNNKDVLNRFNLLEQKNQGPRRWFAFKAKDKKSDVQALEITLEKHDIDRISYKDQIENQVTLDFSEISKGAIAAGKFAYKPPKNAEVTEP